MDEKWNFGVFLFGLQRFERVELSWLVVLFLREDLFDLCHFLNLLDFCLAALFTLVTLSPAKQQALVGQRYGIFFTTSSFDDAVVL